MSIARRLKRGEGPFWGSLKRLAKATLTFHLPVNNVTRPAWRALYIAHVTVRESWIWARRFFWNEPLFRSQCAAVGRGFCMEELPYIVGQGRIVIGNGVRLSGKPSFGFNNRYREAPEISIGDGTFIAHRCAFRLGSSIRIGRHCLLATGVSIVDYDGHPLDADERRAGISSAPDEIKPVSIGDDVWIGAESLILKGVNIGDRAIVGARSVVTRNVPADCIVAGNPARVIRQLAQPQARQETQLQTAESVG